MQRILLLAGILGCTLATQAQAADLILLCSVIESPNSGGQLSYQRRFEINFDSRYVAVFENRGRGFYKVDDGNLYDATNEIIQLSKDNLGEAYIDRRSGEYRSWNSNTSRRGQCERQIGDNSVKF